MPKYRGLFAALLLLKVQSGLAAVEMIEIGQHPVAIQSDGVWAIPFEFERSDEDTLDVWIRILNRKDPYEPLTQLGSDGPVFSAQLINKVGLAAGFGWLLGKKPDLDAILEKSEGIRIETKVGLGGGQLAVGLRERVWAVFFPLDYDLKATYLLNWNNLRVEGSTLDRNYFGMEADVAFSFSRISLGVYRSAEGSAFDDPRAWAGVVTWGI